MRSSHARTAVLLVAAIAITAAPVFAQRGDRRRDGEGGGRRGGVERAQPGGRVASQPRAERRGRVEANRGTDDRGRDGRSVGSRPDGGRYREPAQQYRGDNGRRYSNRSYANRPYYNRPYYNRPYNYRSYNYGSYGHRPYYRPGFRSYVVPFGYRPYGYRRGWNLNLYFGRPYAAYGYPGYAYPSAGYGYYPLNPGRPYGAVRIVDALPDARVFVDGYYAGVVDDYDGVFQHLNLEAGAHQIEIEAPGYPPIAFDVQVMPGQTITYRANIH